MSLLTKNLIEHLAGFDDLAGCIKLVLGITGAFSPRTLTVACWPLGGFCLTEMMVGEEPAGLVILSS